MCIPYFLLLGPLLIMETKLGLDDKTDCVIYTNIGNNKVADARLRAAGGGRLFEASAIIQLSHSRGADEFRKIITLIN